MSIDVNPFFLAAKAVVCRLLCDLFRHVRRLCRVPTTILYRRLSSSFFSLPEINHQMMTFLESHNPPPLSRTKKEMDRNLKILKAKPMERKMLSLKTNPKIKLLR
jgi:hypothetical protein